MSDSNKTDAEKAAEKEAALKKVKIDPAREKAADAYKPSGVKKVKVVKGKKTKKIFPINVPNHILAGWDIVKEEK